MLACARPTIPEFFRLYHIAQGKDTQNTSTMANGNFCLAGPVTDNLCRSTPLAMVNANLTLADFPVVFTVYSFCKTFAGPKYDQF